LLGALYYLGHGWDFDDLEEATNINKETHRQFLPSESSTWQFFVEVKFF